LAVIRYTNGSDYAILKKLNAIVIIYNLVPTFCLSFPLHTFDLALPVLTVFGVFGVVFGIFPLFKPTRILQLLKVEGNPALIYGLLVQRESRQRRKKLPNCPFYGFLKLLGRIRQCQSSAPCALVQPVSRWRYRKNCPKYQVIIYPGYLKLGVGS
jgi:hypothetical protein